VASAKILDNPSDLIKSWFNAKTDFGMEIDKKLVIVLKEVDKTPVDII